jgi:hypothetical protein
MFHLDPCDFELQIMVENYTSPIYLGEYSITSLFMEIIVYNCAFSKDHQSILHALLPLVVETTYALHVFFLFS